MEKTVELLLEELRQLRTSQILSEIEGGDSPEKRKERFATRQKIIDLESGIRAEEIKEEEDRQYKAWHKEEVLKIIGDAKSGYEKSGTDKGKVKCPICKDGDFFWHIASTNGHIWAGCTKHCITIIE